MGDALGQPTEGWTPGRVAEHFGYISGFIGEVGVSDDTEYTLYAAKLVLEHSVGLTRHSVAEAWLRDIVPLPGPFKGAGFSELAAAENLRRGLRPPHSGKHIHSWSDGFAMRVVPFATLYPGNPTRACALAQEDGVVSHAGEGLYSGLAVTAAISVALAGASLENIKVAALGAVPASSWTARSLEEGWQLGSKHGTAKSAIDDLYNALAVTHYPWADLGPEAVGLTFGLLRAGQGNFEESVLAAVNLGRDADTVAALIGAILGASLGFEALPIKWHAAVGVVTGRCLPSVHGMDIYQVAEDLAAVSQAPK